jgi:hypothetical protein
MMKVVAKKKKSAPDLGSHPTGSTELQKREIPFATLYTVSVALRLAVIGAS